jgi:hypothetical protein
VWKALDLVELREVAVKVHQLNNQWSEERKVRSRAVASTCLCNVPLCGSYVVGSVMNGPWMLVSAQPNSALFSLGSQPRTTRAQYVLFWRWFNLSLSTSTR